MSDRRLIIGVAGGTGSGKTTVAKGIVRLLGAEHVALIAQDSYYKNLGHLTAEDRARFNFDHPDAVDVPLLVEHLRQLAEGRPINEPVYDFVTHVRRPETRRVEPRDVVICEGILILALPEVREVCAIKLFVHTDDDLRFIRRLTRDLRERGRTLEAVIDQYLHQVRPMHEAFVEPSRRYADLIVPEGGHNKVAIDMIAARVRDELRGRGVKT
jgi:uridine kinase